MTWNYRIVSEEAPDGELFYQIYEVYYDEEKIIGMTEAPCKPYGDDVEDLRSNLKQMLQALDRPILQMDALDNAFKQKGVYNEK
tara:strand:- start:329 stop:580 length:252 start_codon:yes stop_codon:yes gene_type:complete